MIENPNKSKEILKEFEISDFRPISVQINSKSRKYRSESAELLERFLVPKMMIYWWFELEIVSGVKLEKFLEKMVETKILEFQVETS